MHPLQSSETPVTEENKLQYIEDVSRFLLETSVSAEIAALRQGIYKLVCSAPFFFEAMASNTKCTAFDSFFSPAAEARLARQLCSTRVFAAPLR